MKQVSVFLAEGFEEIEALTVTDLLRRAGINVQNVSVTGQRIVKGSHQIGVETDALFEEMDFTNMDMLVLPGGMPGTLNLQKHEGLETLLKQFYLDKKYLAAICAAPTVLGAWGFLENRKACCYPSMEEQLKAKEVIQNQEVVVDEMVITSRGLGTAIPFALKLIELLCGNEKAEEIGKSIVYL
ncbi:MAG: DJ-1/PfpI family protein [Candidatus Ruminococcus intestinipullorum]|nr:DJ-1/PfpI family protein [Candidatus Ruminococcus intestinipullorum]